MLNPANAKPAGHLGLQVIRGQIPVDHLTVAGIIRSGLPQDGLPDEVNRYRLANARNLWRGAWRASMARALRVPTMYGALHARIIRPTEVVDLGLISMRVITDAGVAYLVDAFQGTTEPENFKYHGFGTGSTAEAANQTALVTELTTQYATDNTRPTGSQTEGAANVYRTVATLTPDAGATIAEHGLFSATSAGTMLDRSQFTGLALVVGDSLQVTYDLTLTSGG